MSEPDSPSRRRPPTIDLTAQEVETEATRSSAGGGTAPNRFARWNFFAGPMAPQAIAAAAGALIMAIVIAIFWGAGIIPSRSGVAPAHSDKAEPQIAAQLAALEAQTKTLGDSLAALNRRLDDIAVTAKSAGERADAAAAAAKATAQSAQTAAQSAVQRSDLDALAARIAALDRQITALGNAAAQRTSGANDRAARAALAAEALRAAVERGAPYAAELAAVQSLGVAAADVAPLEPFAASGIPSAADLARELAQLTPALQKRGTGAPPGDASFLTRLENNAKNLVRVTPVDAPPGDEPAAVIARLNIAAAHADIAAALADVPRLPQPAQTLAASWLQKANARNAAIAAARRIAADALAGLGKSNSQ